MSELLQDISFEAGPDGDLERVEGMNNLKKWIFRCLQTVKSSIAHHPEFGAEVRKFQNVINSLDARRRLAGTIKEELEKDTRVEKVTSIIMEPNNDVPGMVIITVKVVAVGRGETSFSYEFFGD